MMTRISTLLALALAAGLIAAGCGDDDEDTSTTTSSTTTSATGATGATGGATGAALTKDEFVKQADAICAASDKDIDAAGQDLGAGKPSDQEFEQFVNETLVPEIQGQIDGIRALTPPEGDEGEVSAILDAAQDAVDQLEQDPSALNAQSGNDSFKEANQLAKDYGLKECG